MSEVQHYPTDELENAIRNWRTIELEYKTQWGEKYNARTEENHETRLELALLDVDKNLRQRYHEALTEVDVLKAKLDERWVKAHEDLQITRTWSSKTQ